MAAMWQSSPKALKWLPNIEVDETAGHKMAATAF